jgi:hypothetical protein
MTYVTVGILTTIFSSIGYFVFSIKIYYSIIGWVIGVVAFLIGYIKSPLGWILIENHVLKINGLEDTIDTRQLKEIILKNDSITFVNIYSEDCKSSLLKLDPTDAERIKNFLGQKLQKNEVSVIDHVQ